MKGIWATQVLPPWASRWYSNDKYAPSENPNDRLWQDNDRKCSLQWKVSRHGTPSWYVDQRSFGSHRTDRTMLQYFFTFWLDFCYRLDPHHVAWGMPWNQDFSRRTCSWTSYNSPQVPWFSCMPAKWTLGCLNGTSCTALRHSGKYSPCTGHFCQYLVGAHGIWATCQSWWPKIQTHFPADQISPCSQLRNHVGSCCFA